MMQDKTAIGNNEHTNTPSKVFREYIESLVEEIVINNAVFNDHKKYLQRYSQEEGLDYTTLEKNLKDFFEVVEDWKRHGLKSSELMAKMLAKEWYLEDGKVNELMAAMNEAREKEAERIAAKKKAEEERIALEKAEREAKEEKERREREEAERKAAEEAEYREKMKKAEELFQKWANYYPPGTRLNFEMAEKIIHLLKESAALGYAKAQNFLSEAYRNGLGVKKNYKEAFRLSMSSAIQNNAGGQVDVGVAYLFGQGVEPDNVLAFSWLSKSAQNGNPMGMTYLAICYLHGIGTTKNKEYAEKLVTQAEEKYRLKSSDPKRVSLPSRIVECWKNFESIERVREEFKKARGE